MQNTMGFTLPPFRLYFLFATPMHPCRAMEFTSLPCALWFKGRRRSGLDRSASRNPADSLIASVNLPVTAQVTEASPDAPYLGFKLEFTANQIFEVLRDSNIRVGPKENAKRGMFVSRLEPSLMDAVTRSGRGACGKSECECLVAA